MFVVLAAVLAVGSVAQADIIDWSCQDDGDGGIVMNQPSWSEVGAAEYKLEMSGAQYWYPAHVDGDFITDTPDDPTVWIIETVENQTNFTWTDYHITIGMDKPFQIIGVVSPLDWTWNITQPVDGQPIPSHTTPGTGWVGRVDYLAGTPIPVGGSGNFGVVVSFLGSVSFFTEQVPTPEPTSLLLLAFGGLFLARKR
jgi:hypothetical protein